MPPDERRAIKSGRSAKKSCWEFFSQHFNTFYIFAHKEETSLVNARTHNQVHQRETPSTIYKYSNVDDDIEEDVDEDIEEDADVDEDVGMSDLVET